MTGLIIATSIIGTVLIATIVVGAIKFHRMEQNLTTLAQCFLAYTSNPESVNIVEDYTVGKRKRHSSDKSDDFNFPNSEGFL